MSSERELNTDPGVTPQPTLTQDLSCSFCEMVAGPALALQCYASETGECPAGVDHSDGVVLCRTCAEEVTELLATWTSQGRPAVDSGASIGDGYGRVASACSFCDDSLRPGAVTGVELYERPGERLPSYANYTLCPDCRHVFGEFLCNVRAAQNHS